MTRYNFAFNLISENPLYGLIDPTKAQNLGPLIYNCANVSHQTRKGVLSH